MVIEESFRASAPKSVVYAFLRDPEKCFPCLPGATYGSTDPATGRFDGAITVKVGPLTVAYDGSAIYEVDDPAAGRLVIKGQGREKSGSGVVRMDLTCDVVEADGATEVKVVANVELAGAIVRLGRGMIKGVSEQVFQGFVTRATARLEAEAAATTASVPAVPPTAAAPANGLVLFFRAVMSMIRGLFRRPGAG